MGGDLAVRRGDLTRLAVAAIAVFAALSCGPATAAGLPRIASMNVCTDQLLITLADPEQILGKVFRISAYRSEYQREAVIVPWAEI
jgi:hypothetical protein